MKNAESREQIMKFRLPLELLRNPEFPLTIDLVPSRRKDLQMVQGICSSAGRDEAARALREVALAYGSVPLSLDEGTS